MALRSEVARLLDLMLAGHRGSSLAGGAHGLF